ncbi:hypothetical protein SBBP2_940008 [Burkholderiales bacterium]|nr:hypothetical protein SBBP2_940008 [Burkholderiales bacterium]
MVAATAPAKAPSAPADPDAAAAITVAIVHPSRQTGRVMLAMSTFATTALPALLPGFTPALLVPQVPQPETLGLTNVSPDSMAVSVKSTVKPSSIRRLCSGKNTFKPLTSRAPSPGLGAGSTVNSEEYPEQPPSVTVKRNPASAPAPPKRTMRRMKRSAAEVIVMFMRLPQAAW